MPAHRQVLLVAAWAQVEPRLLAGAEAAAVADSVVQKQVVCVYTAGYQTRFPKLLQ